MFSQQFGLELRKIPEAAAPTPDFDVYRGRAHVAVLEVKGLESTAPIVTARELAANEAIASAVSVDNSAARVAKKIHEAVRQLAGSRLPKIVVLLNDDDAVDRLDLQEALLGYLDYEGEPISALPLLAQEWVRSDRGKIDLFVWFDPTSAEGPHFISATAMGRHLRSRYFDGSPIGRAA